MLKTNPGVRITWIRCWEAQKEMLLLRKEESEKVRKWERWKRLNDKLSMLDCEKVQSHWQLLGFSKLFPPHHQHSGLPDLLESRLPGWTRARVAFSTSGVPAATQVVKVNNCNICSSNIIFQQQQQNVISSLPDLLEPRLTGWTRARVAFLTLGVPAATQVVKVNNCNICSSNIIFQQQQQNVISSSLPDLLKPGLPGWTLNSESNMFTTGSERTW